MTLDCVLCGHPLIDVLHHTDEARDEGHAPLPCGTSDRYLPLPVSVPAKVSAGSLWDAGWHDAVRGQR